VILVILDIKQTINLIIHIECSYPSKEHNMVIAA